VRRRASERLRSCRPWSSAGRGLVRGWDARVGRRQALVRGVSASWLFEFRQALSGHLLPAWSSGRTRGLSKLRLCPRRGRANRAASDIVAPQAATATDTDPEYLNKGVGQDWDTAIATQLPDRIDADFRTIPDRAGRAIVGASAGGYGAMLLGLHHLARFSVIESWSGYFHPTDPTGTKSIASSPWQNAHSFVHSLRRALVVHPTLIAFYVGDADTLFRAENVEYARELSRARVPFRFRIVPGGHQQSLWAAQAPDWLTLALARLEQPH
jgi:Putative esterase